MTSINDGLNYFNKDVWCKLRTSHGEFRMYAPMNGSEDYCLISYGAAEKQSSPTLLRIQSSCLASETFGSRDCDCAEQITLAFKNIARASCGLCIYLRQEGRGAGLASKIRGMQISDTMSYDTFDAYRWLGIPQDTRDYALAIRILKEIEISQVRLMTNNPRKVQALRDGGIQVIEIVPHVPPIRKEFLSYLKTKVDKLGHNIKEDNFK